MLRQRCTPVAMFSYVLIMKPSGKQLKKLHNAIRRWYAAHGRHSLPWRTTGDAYAIHVSEVMLQQTQVNTVLARYYRPFLQQFPTLQALAGAPLDAVMKAWEGLGYYNRAVHLQQAAQQAGDSLPQTVEELMALPGIGRNTAHAIAAFAYRQPVPVLEANVKRVLYRLQAWEQATEARLWQAAESLLDREDPFTYNQAMMDIGALVCRRERPRCEICPLAAACKGKTSPERFPAPRRNKKTPVRQRLLVLCMDDAGRLYLQQNDRRFLRGLYGFPQYAPQEKQAAVAGSTLSLQAARPLGRVRHTYSHFTLQAEVRLARLEEITADTANWFTRQQVTELALSRADQKALALLDASISDRSQTVTSRPAARV